MEDKREYVVVDVFEDDKDLSDIEKAECVATVCPVIRVLAEKVANLYFGTFSYDDENTGFEGLTLLKRLFDEGKYELSVLTLRMMFAIEGEMEAAALFDVLDAASIYGEAPYGIFMDAFLNDEDIALMVWTDGIRVSLAKLS